MPRAPKAIKRPMGNAVIPIDWSVVEKAAMEGSNGIQIAAHLGICKDTLYDRCELEHGVTWSAYLAEKRSKGDKLIHQAQFKKALSGNPTILIWLGKQRLDQRDSDHEKDKLPPLDDLVEKDNENMSLKAQLAIIMKELEDLKAKIDHKPETGS